MDTVKMKMIPYAMLALSMSVALVGCKKSEPTVVQPAGENREVMAIDTPPPMYPLKQFCTQVGGIVELEIGIGTDGMVNSVRTVKSSNVPELDAAAIDAARKYKFQAALLNGKPIQKKIRVPVNFNPSKVPDERCTKI